MKALNALTGLVTILSIAMMALLTFTRIADYSFSIRLKQSHSYRSLASSPKIGTRQVAAELVRNTIFLTGKYRLLGACNLPLVKSLKVKPTEKVALSVKQDDLTLAHQLVTREGNTVSVSEKINAYLTLTVTVDPVTPAAPDPMTGEAPYRDAEDMQLTALFPYAFPLAPLSSAGYKRLIETPEAYRKANPQMPFAITDSVYFYETSLTKSTVRSRAFEQLTVSDPKNSAELRVEKRNSTVDVKLEKKLAGDILTIELKSESDVHGNSHERCEFIREKN